MMFKFDLRNYLKIAVVSLLVYVLVFSFITVFVLHQPQRLRKLWTFNNVTARSPQSTGYVIAAHFSDQQTNALKNLMSLQCWAGHSGAEVVVLEPFLDKTQFGVPFTRDRVAAAMTFRDLFDIQQWEEKSNSYSAPKFAKLASWDSFIYKAPRDTILVEIKYADGVTPKELLKQNVNCTALNVTKFPMDILQNSGFVIVRKVCLDYENLGMPTIQEFNVLVYGPYAPSNVSVVFQEWRGVTNTTFHRVRIFESPCYINNFADFSAVIESSLNVTNDAYRYISKFLGNESYIALMLRLEQLVIMRKSDSIRAWKMVISFCLNNIFKTLKGIQTKQQLKHTFIAMDVGKYGSKGWREGERAKLDIKNEVQNFLGKIYNEETTLEKWEQTFESVAGTTNPAYVATLQSMIASRAECLILTGGGFFQERALQSYLQSHPSNHSCYVEIDKQSCARWHM